MKHIAIYDFDGTLYNGETISDFYFFLCKKRPILYMWLPYLFLLLTLKKLHLITLKFFKEEAFRFFGRRISKNDIYDFWTEQKRYFFPWVKKQLEYDKRRGYLLVCISATPENLLFDIVLKYLKFDVLIATKLNPNDNRKIIGKNCKGKEKVLRFYDWANKYKVGSYIVEKMVSDSSADKPLYQLAKQHLKVDKEGRVSTGIPTKYI